MKAYAIADLPERADEDRFLARVEALSRAGVDLIQLRAKHLDDRDLLDLASRCRRLISADVLYLINGRADIALAADADGVHLPSDGVPVSVARAISSELKIGVSCHSVEDVGQADEAEADLVVLGPVFEARSSWKPPAISITQLKEASNADLEVYALGGLTTERLALLEGTGIRGVAAITMFMEDEPLDQIVAAVHEAGS